MSNNQIFTVEVVEELDRTSWICATFSLLYDAQAFCHMLQQMHPPREKYVRYLVSFNTIDRCNMPFKEAWYADRQ